MCEYTLLRLVYIIIHVFMLYLLIYQPTIVYSM
jgi:hypothetical protein